MMRFPAYDGMLKTAARHTEVWRVAAALGIALALTAIGSPLALGLIGQIAPELRAISTGIDGMQIGATPGALFLIFSGFAITLMGTVVLAKRLHGRSLHELTGPPVLMRAQARLVFKWIIGMTFLSFLLPWDAPETEIARQLGFGAWLAWLPLGILGLAIQVCAEEVFFRGYLQSQMIATTRSYTKGLVLTALLFGVGHYNGQMSGIAALFPVVWATAFGLMAGDLTMRAGTLGPAIAVHFVNNAMAMFFAPMAGNLSGFGLWVQKADFDKAYSDPKMMLYEGLILLITWLVARIALKR